MSFRAKKKKKNVFADSTVILLGGVGPLHRIFLKGGEARGSRGIRGKSGGESNREGWGTGAKLRGQQKMLQHLKSTLF